MTKRPRKLFQHKIRVAADLHSLVQNAADNHGQSINAEINDRLRRSFHPRAIVVEGTLSPEQLKQFEKKWLESYGLNGPARWVKSVNAAIAKATGA